MEQFSLWQVLVLAVVQGITEFLPVSSDGHLSIVEPLIWAADSPRPNSMDLTIVLHLGTLGSILAYYRRRIVRLIGDDRRVLWQIIVGTLPAVALVLVAKVLLDELFEPLLKNTLLAGWMLLVTGAAMFWAQHHGGGDREYRELRWPESLLIGVAQAAAILPGLSRSGSTIATELTLGLSRPAAATFSFLLAIPALAGAGLYEAVSMMRHEQPLSTAPAHLAIGAVVAFGVGLAALSLLEQTLKHGRLRYFGWYCVGLGLVVIILNWPR